MGTREYSRIKWQEVFDTSELSDEPNEFCALKKDGKDEVVSFKELVEYELTYLESTGLGQELFHGLQNNKDKVKIKADEEKVSQASTKEISLKISELRLIALPLVSILAHEIKHIYDLNKNDLQYHVNKFEEMRGDKLKLLEKSGDSYALIFAKKVRENDETNKENLSLLLDFINDVGSGIKKLNKEKLLLEASELRGDKSLVEATYEKFANMHKVKSSLGMEDMLSLQDLFTNIISFISDVDENIDSKTLGEYPESKKMIALISGGFNDLKFKQGVDLDLDSQSLLEYLVKAKKYHLIAPVAIINNFAIHPSDSVNNNYLPVLEERGMDAENSILMLLGVDKKRLLYKDNYISFSLPKETLATSQNFFDPDGDHEYQMIENKTGLDDETFKIVYQIMQKVWLDTFDKESNHVLSYTNRLQSIFEDNNVNPHEKFELNVIIKELKMSKIEVSYDFKGKETHFRIPGYYLAADFNVDKER